MRNFALGARGPDVLMGRLTLNMLLSFAQFEREIAFSILSAFSLRASDTSILPNFAFHRVGDSSMVEQRSDSVNPGSNPGPPATSPVDITVFYQFSFASEFVRHVRRLLTLHHNGPIPETQNRSLRRAMARDALGAVFDPPHVEHCAGSARRQAGAKPPAPFSAIVIATAVRVSFPEDHPDDRRRHRSRRSDGLKPDASSVPRLDRARANARPRLRQATRSGASGCLSHTPVARRRHKVAT